MQVSYPLSDSRYSARVMSKMCSFLKKGTKQFFANFLEFMLSFDKMQNTIPLMCTKFVI